MFRKTMYKRRPLFIIRADALQPWRRKNSGPVLSLRIAGASGPSCQAPGSGMMKRTFRLPALCPGMHRKLKRHLKQQGARLCLYNKKRSQILLCRSQPYIRH